MTYKEIENLMSKFEEYKFEDFIEIENENLTSSKIVKHNPPPILKHLSYSDELRDNKKKPQQMRFSFKMLNYHIHYGFLVL